MWDPHMFLRFVWAHVKENRIWEWDSPPPGEHMWDPDTWEMSLYRKEEKTRKVSELKASRSSLGAVSQINTKKQLSMFSHKSWVFSSFRDSSIQFRVFCFTLNLMKPARWPIFGIYRHLPKTRNSIYNRRMSTCKFGQNGRAHWVNPIASPHQPQLLEPVQGSKAEPEKPRAPKARTRARKRDVKVNKLLQKPDFVWSLCEIVRTPPKSTTQGGKMVKKGRAERKGKGSLAAQRFAWLHRVAAVRCRNQECK